MESQKDKARNDMINILRKLSDVRFDLEMYAVEYGDETQILEAESRKITEKMRTLGTQFLIN